LFKLRRGELNNHAFFLRVKNNSPFRTYTPSKSSPFALKKCRFDATNILKDSREFGLSKISADIKIDYSI
jgi:hypothetical protein